MLTLIGLALLAGCPSWHHQMIDSVAGTSLRVTGTTPVCGRDTIEAIERTDRPFAVGIQFHPEAAVTKHLDHVANAGSYMPKERAVAFFRALVDAARKR